MSGTGNDFIVIDNRKGVIPDESKHNFIKRVCTPKTSVGADGVIFIESSDSVDFRWDFYNADGSSAEMCGNGCRCVAMYAYERDIAGKNMTFETIAGMISAEVNGNSVKIQMTSPQDFRQNLNISLEDSTIEVDSLNTGVPHAIIYCENVENQDLKKTGAAVRHHSCFAPSGTNVNFVQVIDGQTLKIRTFERGVEGETLACGTGAVASAILAGCKGLVKSPTTVKIASGETLKIHFDNNDYNGSFGTVFLEGPAITTFEGTINDS